VSRDEGELGEVLGEGEEVCVTQLLFVRPGKRVVRGEPGPIAKLENGKLEEEPKSPGRSACATRDTDSSECYGLRC